MDDLKILHDAWGAPEAPSPSARAQARAAMLARRPRPRGVRVAAAAGLAAALATGMFVVGNLGGDGRPRSVVPGLPGVPPAAAAVLERAAVAAERRPFTAPRNDQWIYIRERLAGDGPETRQIWRRADGGGMAWIEHGELEVQTHERPMERTGRPAPFDNYTALAALPTDPDALLRWAYDQARTTTGGGVTEHGDVYLILEHMMAGNVLPPELEAAIFRALKQVPGVTVDTVEVFGRPVLALALTEDWLRQELLLDPDTYTYRGQRSTVVRDAVIDPLKAGNSTGEVRRGSTVVVAREATAIVDEPGERP